jgi:deazaflavin-dependent oxidoreductase (nitroreductase family)
VLTQTETRYLEPGWFTRRVFNPTIAFLTRRGISLWGSRVLTVTGRRSGVARDTVVNVLTLDGHRYLVAPRGHTQWVRNLRASRSATLRVGRRVETVTAVLLADADKVPVIRAYLERWKWEIGQFFDGLDHTADDPTIAAVAPGFPVFVLG